MKRSASPGDEDGPGQKHLAHPTQQVQGASTKKEARTIRLREVLWSGKLEFHDVHKQKRFLSSCSVRSREKINTVNWPKQLKMTTIPEDDFIKLICNVYVESPRFVAFSMDEDCDKMSYRAFIQSTSEPNWGCALLEYTSSVISLLFLTSCSLGFIHKYTYQDRVVEFLADFGILSHATTANMFAKENGRLKEELQQKDKMLVDQQMHHQEEMKSQKEIVEEITEQLTRMEVEMEALMKEKDKDLRKLDTLKKEMERLEKEKEKIQTSRSELENKVHTKQTTLEDLEKELMCIICHQPINRAIALKCGHAVCNQCLDKTLDYNVEEPPTCPICRGRIRLRKLGPSIVIDNCIGIINQHRSEDEARQIGHETETESEGEPIQGEQDVPSQSVSEGSDDESSPVSSPSSSASSSSRAPSSIEDLFSSASSSDSD